MLEEYVHKPDPNFRYRLVNKVRGEGFTVFVLDMTSQQWRTSAEVDCPVWRHWLMIVKPDQVQGTAGIHLRGLEWETGARHGRRGICGTGYWDPDSRRRAADGSQPAAYVRR